MREEVVRKQALFDFGQQALSEHAVSSLLDKAASTLSQALQVEFVKIMEFLPHEESFILRAGRGWKPHFMGREKVGAELNSIAGFTLRASRPTIPGDLRTLEPVMIEDLTTETRFSPAPFIREHGIRSGVSVLIHGKDQEHPYGILGVHSTEKRCFSADEAQFLQAAANVLAAALLRMRLEDELLRSAHTLEERVKQRTADLEESKDALEAFGYSVSHDLRAPLRTMQGFANALLEDYADVLDGEGRDYAARISRGARRMDLLIEDLLTYSRLSRGDITLKRLDLVSVLQEAQRQVEAALAETGGTILIHPPDVPLVFGHEATLVQVFANLLSNALKFVEPHVRPSVTIRTEQRGAWVTITVTDNGIGVEPAHQDEIFSVFQRLHGSERYPGTGIGLAIVKKGVERLGGRVGVTSHTGQGSSFWVELRAAGSLE